MEFSNGAATIQGATVSMAEDDSTTPGHGFEGGREGQPLARARLWAWPRGLPLPNATPQAKAHPRASTLPMEWSRTMIGSKGESIISFVIPIR